MYLMHSFYVMTENSIKLMIPPLFSLRPANLKAPTKEWIIIVSITFDSAYGFFLTKCTINTHS